MYYPTTTATGWAIRTGQIQLQARSAAPPPSAETYEQAIRCEVKRADVDPALVEEIERTVRMASLTLGLNPAPRLCWLPAGVKGLRGVVFPDALSEVWVTVQDAAKARETALHELRHVWQLRGDRYLTMGLLTYEQRQADADEFARTWRWDMPPVAAPAVAHHQRSAPQVASRYTADPRRDWPKRETYEHKGLTYVVCEQCDDGVPMNTTHRCPAAYGRRAR